MSDPVSLGAAGAGFVSLGLTVCDAIYKYTNAQAGKSAGMRQLRETADDLKSAVKLIEARLVNAAPSQNAASVATKTAIEGKIASCKAAANCILELVEKHEPAKATMHTFTERTKRLARAGLYPMRREGIMELQQACQGYSLNLVLLLQLFGVDGIDELRNVLVAKMDAMATAVSSNVSGLEQSFLTATSAEGTRVVQETRDAVLQSEDTLVQTIEAASSRTEAAITSAGQTSVVAIIEAGAQQSQRTQDLVLQRLDSVGEKMLLSIAAQPRAVSNRISQELQTVLAESIHQAISAHMEAVETLLRSRPAETPSIATMEGSSGGTAGQPISGSSGGAFSSETGFPASSNGGMLTASGCRRPPTRERRAGLANDLGPGSARAVAQGCTCSAPALAQVSQPRRYFGSLWLRWEESVVHHRKCPLWYLSRRRRTFQVNISAFGFAVYGPIEVENSPFFWLKQLHIDPKLSFRSVVQSNSLVFRLIDGYFDGYFWSIPAGGWLDHAHRLESELSELFRNGEASPTDVDPDGNTLIHRLCSEFDPRYNSTKQEGLQIMASILLKMGVPASETNNRGHTPSAILYESLQRSPTNYWYYLLDAADILGTLAPFFDALGALDDPETWCADKIGILVQTKYAVCTRLTTFGCPLSIASAQGDVDKVRSLLGTSPELLATEKNMLDQTPLHHAVLRPGVLTLLLACPTSASIIDHEDCSGNSAMYYACAVESSETLLMLSESGASLEPVLAFFDSPHYFANGSVIYQLIARACRSRLEGLIRLGIAHGCASDAQLTQFPHPLELLNKVARALRDKGVEIPVSISSAIPHRPFGHLRGLDTSLAGSLWDQGLFILDEGYNGIFPILRQHEHRVHSDLRDWLWSKNPRLDIPTGLHGLDVAHVVAAGFGDVRYCEPPYELIRACLSYTPPIGIKCFCMGATSIFIPIRRFGRRTSRLCRLLRLLREVDLLEEQPFDFLRALTFGALQLVHTCPVLRNPYEWSGPYDRRAEDRNWELPVMEAAEIERINQEQDEPIVRFEKLLDELNGEYHESHLPFPEFLDLVWFPRMLDKVDRFGPQTAGFLDGISAFLEGKEIHTDESSDGEQSSEN
ncbi:hypothetical protein MAPG_00926 [Magnaporthiopsis poae ATCC 64411]|uniref:Uncharacterized protein n=1 Tax=Magnaporthiopsis poae (strain ATCC 64411 / 73-15) TaxID=644358 RepID=A0A0C4DMC1_MAGP6|nr:hypothetical protein MAPG_00926 [Magnaporthiopsis poae ATCC 64411]